MKKIGIIGSGIVGQTLSNGMIKHGYEVMLGTGNLQKLEEWKNKYGEKARVGSFKEAAQFGDILIFAIKGSSAEEVIKSIGIEATAGKTIIDATNPIDDRVPPRNGVIKFFTKPGESLMERLQNIAYSANFVKAFNIVGAALMVNPDFGTIKPTMFICGNSAFAKKEVTEILDQFGWEVEDMGMSNAAAAIENLCILWCIPLILHNDRSPKAFKLLRK